jgi:exoribonuclease II
MDLESMKRDTDMEPGRVIEFIEGRSFLTALVTRVKGSKVLALAENDREMNVGMNRIFHVTSPGLDLSQPRHELVRCLKDISFRRREKAERIDLREIWELLSGEGDTFDYSFLTELVFSGLIADDELAATIRSVFNDGLYFKMRPDGAIRNNEEKVRQIIETRIREEERENELAEGGQWLGHVWEDECVDEEPACRDRVVHIMRDMAIRGQDASEYKWGQRLLERAGLGRDELKPFQILVKLGEMGFHENLDLSREAISVDFPSDVLAEAMEMSRDQTWMNEDRRDLTSLNIITVDSGGARDFDDAVSLETIDGRYILGVHIADVSALVKPGMALDDEALERATSIYMPDRKIPMLPEILSDECLSLKEKQVRPAFSLRVELDETGQVYHHEFFPSLLAVKRQLSYQEVDGSIETDLVLNRMWKLSQSLKARRVKQGALILPLPKLNVYITPEGEIGVNLTYWENPGRSMIGEFMILANHLAARFLRDAGAGCFYRFQPEPNERLVEGDVGCEDLFPCLRQRRYLGRVDWGVEPKPHSGMGLDVYTNLTSPLRRYIDLVMHRQLRSFLAGSEPLYSRDDLREMLTRIETARRKAFRVQNKRRRYWLMRYLEAHQGRKWEALVLERLPHRWLLFIPELMLDTDLPAKPGITFEPGQKITLRVRRVNAREDVLRFEPA